MRSRGALLALRFRVTQLTPVKVILIVVESLDGFITRHDTPGAGWASGADQRWFRSCLQDFDCRIMGRKTYETVRETILAHPTPAVRRMIMTHSPAAWAADSIPGVLEFTAASPTEIVESLRQDGRQQCALLGGAQVHDAFLAAGLVDELWVTLEPRLFGTGTPLIQTRQDISLRLLSHTRLDDSDSLVLRYAVSR